jgi:hypothetical protein
VFGVAPKVNGTERFQDQVENHGKKPQPPRVPLFRGTTGAKGPQGTTTRPKKPGTPDPETHL